eukprot:1158827-Pelagomonas_calceolata.AAC.3
MSPFCKVALERWRTTEALGKWRTTVEAVEAAAPGEGHRSEGIEKKGVDGIEWGEMAVSACRGGLRMSESIAKERMLKVHGHFERSSFEGFKLLMESKWGSTHFEWPLFSFTFSLSWLCSCCWEGGFLREELSSAPPQVPSSPAAAATVAAAASEKKGLLKQSCHLGQRSDSRPSLLDDVPSMQLSMCPPWASLACLAEDLHGFQMLKDQHPWT